VSVNRADFAGCADKESKKIGFRSGERLTTIRRPNKVADDDLGSSAPAPPGWDNGAAPVCFFRRAAFTSPGGGRPLEGRAAPII
jgi:hypothetical protein